MGFGTSSRFKTSFTSPHARRSFPQNVHKESLNDRFVEYILSAMSAAGLGESDSSDGGEEMNENWSRIKI